jgi:hypothetical protein
MTATKLPTSTGPLIKDPDLAAAIEEMLEPYEGEELREAQAACREVHSSPILGQFGQLVAAYQTKIDERVEKHRAAEREREARKKKSG